MSGGTLEELWRRTGGSLKEVLRKSGGSVEEGSSRFFSHSEIHRAPNLSSAAAFQSKVFGRDQV